MAMSDPAELKTTRPMRRTARWIAFAAFLIFVLSGGGRIVGSDEVTMLELGRSLLGGHIDVPEGATLDGPGGRHYTKNAPGQALLALPLVAVAEVTTRAAGLDPGRRELAVRFVVSFFNAFVTALLLALFYLVARALGAHAGAAFATTLLLGLTTPLWVYAKSFMAEPLQALGLLLALWGALRARHDPGRPWMAASGFVLAVLVKPSMAPLAGMCLAPLWTAGRRGLLRTAAIVATAAALLALYNLARFGTPFETGYGTQASLAAYSTPIYVGLYGLLLSSGKGLAWFAPALWLAPAGWPAMTHAGGARRGAAWALLFAGAGALLLYGTFQHWAGDGSFGPRYLLPLLPLAFLPVCFALDGAGRARRRLVALLGVAGLLVQLGGVSIHFGAQMREAGDYPYSMPLGDPRFMSDSHFNPHFSPILGHWRMMLRNTGEHLRGEWPRLSGGGDRDARIGVSSADQQRLLHALDFWWLYMRYSGLPRLPVALALALLLGLTAFCFRELGRSVEDEAVGA
jgi:hypothetical protein